MAKKEGNWRVEERQAWQMGKVRVKKDRSKEDRKKWKKNERKKNGWKGGT